MSNPKLSVIDSIPPSDEIIPYLEGVLERAKAGEFAAVAVVFVDREGSTGSGWTSIKTMATMVGGVEALKHTLVRVMME